MNIEAKERQYLPVIIREYNLIIKKKSKIGVRKMAEH